MDKTVIGILGGAVVLLVVLVLVAGKNDPTTSFTGEDKEVISQTGIHWHPKLSITIDGQPREVPANLGLSSVGGMQPIHTHDSSGELHWEMAVGPIQKGQVKLARFFEQWGQPFSSTQILDAQVTDTKKITMRVNGQENTELENYLVQDGDVIDISYQ